MSTTIQDIREAKAKIAKFLADYRSIAATANQTQLREASILVEKAQTDLGKLIAAGAKDCPSCKTPVIGMEQPGGDGRTTYEVGCLNQRTSCGPFKHNDGTYRSFSVRGGILPHHTIEAWNAGPDAWDIVAAERVALLLAEEEEEEEEEEGDV